MNQDSTPVFFDNVTKRVVDDLKTTISQGSKVDIAAAIFSMYAYRLLKKELARERHALEEQLK